jgi:hypothetical protein
MPLPYGITLNQTGDTNATYRITVVDENTTEVLYDATAFLNSDGLLLSGNWTGDLRWHRNELPGAFSFVSNAWMDPSNDTVPIPAGHVGNQTYLAIVAGVGSGSSAAYTILPPTGGVWVSVDKFGLLGPYIGLASTTVIAAVATAIYVKRVKRSARAS